MSVRVNKPDTESAKPPESFAQVIMCEPLIAEDLARQFEGVLRSEQFCTSIRHALLLAQRDGEWFKRLSGNVELARHVAPQVEAITKDIDTLRLLIELLAQAQHRGHVAVFKHFRISDLLEPLETKKAKSRKPRKAVTGR